MFRNNKSKATTSEESGIMDGWSMPSSLMTTTTPTKPKSRFQRHSQLKAAASPSSKRKIEKRTEEEEGTIVAITGLIREPASPQVRAPPPSIETSKSSTSNKSSNSSSLLCAVGGGVGGGDKKQKKVIYRNFTSDPKNGMEVWTDERDGAGIPEPATAKSVVIKIMASTVSYSDCILRRGYNMNAVTEPVELPATPGSDVVGNIVKVGLKVKRFKVGDRVASLVRTGGNARYISVPVSNLVEVPRSCDAAEAACMVSTFMTAYQAIRMVTKDQFTLNGKRILITGGIEPVGQALIQLCSRAGADSIYATAPEHRHRYIKSVLGATPLPLEPKDWLPATKGAMDVVFDGSCHDGLDSPYASLKKDGILVCVGMSALLGQQGGNPGVLGAPISAYWTKLKGSLLSNVQTYEVWERFQTNRDEFKLDLEILFHLLKKRFIKPHIAKRVALSEVPSAHASLEQENVRGQIVCLPWKRTAMGK